MKVLDKKFVLPDTREDIRKRMRDERINAVTTQVTAKVSNIFPALKDIETVNSVIEPPKPPASKEVVPPKVIAPVSTPEKPVPEIPEIVVPEPELPEDVVKKLPEFQVRKNTDIPTGMSNMPGHSGSIEMMAQGQTTLLDASSTGWIDAWSFLTEYTPPKTSDPTSDWLVKGLVKTDEAATTELTNIISASNSVPAAGIFKYSGSGWDSLSHAYGKPVILGGEILVMNYNVTTGSPVDRYTGVWESYSGDLPALPAGDTSGVQYSCIHGDELYVATGALIIKPNTGKTAWDTVATLTRKSIRGLVTDGTYLYRAYIDFVPDKAYIYKISGGTETLVASFVDEVDIDYATLGYGGKTGKLYIGLYDSGTWKVYTVTTAGVKTLLTTISSTNTNELMVATGEKYDYLSAGDEVYRLSGTGTVTATEVYTNTTAPGNLTAFDEQVCFSGVSKVFHTEWEGTKDIVSAQTGTATKYGL